MPVAAKLPPRARSEVQILSAHVGFCTRSGKSRMDSCAQCLGARWIFGSCGRGSRSALRSADEARPLRVERRTTYWYCPSITPTVPCRRGLKMLFFSRYWLNASPSPSPAIAGQPLDQRLAAHPIWFRLTGEFENRGCERRLVRGKRNGAAFLLVRCPDDQRNVNNRPSQIRVFMLIDAALKALPMIGRHDDRRVPQFPAVFQFRHEGAESAIGRQDELVVGEATLVHLALLIGFVVRNPATRAIVPFVLKRSSSLSGMKRPRSAASG